MGGTNCRNVGPQGRLNNCLYKFQSWQVLPFLTQSFNQLPRFENAAYEIIVLRQFLSWLYSGKNRSLSSHSLVTRDKEDLFLCTVGPNEISYMCNSALNFFLINIF